MHIKQSTTWIWKKDQWTLLGELEQAFKSYEKATVLLSGEAYVTVFAFPPLLKGLQKAKHQPSFEPSFVISFQTAAAQEGPLQGRYTRPHTEKMVKMCVWLLQPLTLGSEVPVIRWYLQSASQTPGSCTSGQKRDKEQLQQANMDQDVSTSGGP